MKYPNCQFENRNFAELFCGCDKQLRQEIVRPRFNTASPPGRKSYNGHCQPLTEQASAPPKPKKHSIIEPASLINGRSQLKKFRGEVGRKKVCLTHEVLLDRDISFILIKTRKLDDCPQKAYLIT